MSVTCVSLMQYSFQTSIQLIHENSGANLNSAQTARSLLSMFKEIIVVNITGFRKNENGKNGLRKMKTEFEEKILNLVMNASFVKDIAYLTGGKIDTYLATNPCSKI